MEPGDFITAFDYLVEKESLLFGTSNGLLLVHNVESGVTEPVGNVEGGVKCISSSPTGDLLGIITGIGQLLVMTHDWFLMYERALREVQEGVYVREAEDFSGNCGGSSLSWRGDGKYFATMSEIYESSRLNKKIKIWESDSGTLQSSSETKDFVKEILEWMPTGGKIAAVYKKKLDNGTPSVAFFERNGLERSSIRIDDLGEATVSFETLKWNSSSDLLAGVVSCKSHDSIRVWFFSNNHWYLKHEIRYPRQAGIRVMWDLTKPLQLICWTLAGKITLCNFMWVSAVMEDSTAFVVDNSKILVTPLSLSLMPPPMFLFSLRFASAVRDFAYYSRNSKNCLAVYLSDGNLSFVEFPAPNTWEDLEGKEFNVEVSDSKTALSSFIHLLWLDAHSLLCLSPCGSSLNKSLPLGLYETDLHGCYIQELEVVWPENLVPDQVTLSGFEVKIAFQAPLESSVTALALDPVKLDSAFVEFEGGRVLGYSSRSGITEARISDSNVCFSSTCPWLRVVKVDDVGIFKPLICGLDDMGRLFINGTNLCNNCNSFSFYSELANEVVSHLILLTKQDFLFIVDMKDVLQREVEDGNMNFVIDGRMREEENMSYVNIWERGSKIVGVLNGDESAVILQTMRGNLECIFPRKLVLSSIANVLAQQRFKDALNLVRRHRIDFNVIVDLYGWQTFLQSAAKFVEQVNNLNHVTEFVCAMKNEDVTETLYKNFSFPKKPHKDLQVKDGCSNKVSSVLQAIRKGLEEQIPESPSRELCILTTLAQSDPPDIEESLLRIKSVREMELLSSDESRKKVCSSAEEALKHLLWLSDSEAVFEAALGLYDLNLAAIVALNSQRDPKEFLPYLQELERMPEPLMHFNIDLKLQRFDSALMNIVSAGDDYFPDCMDIMKKNPQLFPLGLHLIADPEKKEAVLEAWADHLSDERYFEDAATMYLCCYRLEKASRAYRECGDWSGVLRVGALMKLGMDEILKLAYELCEELNALGRPGDAAKIALEYCGDVSGGISFLISAREWEEALRVAFLHRNDDIISVVKNSALECANGLVSEYKKSVEKVGKYLTRYLAVRQRRLLLAAKLKSEERLVIDLDDDTASVASSNLSGMSAYTLGTRRTSAASVRSSSGSKARDLRRQRKSGKIRAGSAGEEMALVDHLKGLRMTEGGKRELKSLLICLVTLGEKESARKLQQTAENFQVSQVAAVEIADDAVSNESTDEDAFSLERYIKKTRSTRQNSDAFSWMLEVFISP